MLVFHAGIYARGENQPPRLPAEVVYGETVAGLLGRLNQGVILFFVLSGYLIARPFVRAVIEDRGMPSLRVYVPNRLLRIVPLFWVFAVLAIARHGTLGADLGELLAILGFAQVLHPSELSHVVFPHAWTLDAEMAFYLAVPLLALTLGLVLRGRLGPGARAAAIAAGCVLVAGLSVHLRSRTDPGAEYPWLFGAAFAPGVLLAVADVRFAERLRGAPGIPAIALGMVVVGVIGTGWVPPVTDGPELGRVTRPLSAGLIVGGALLLEWGRGRSWRVLDNRVMRWLGARGYGIYLFQVLVVLELAEACRDLGGYRGLALMLAVTVPATLLLADLGHRLVERPALRRKRRPVTAGT